MNEHKKVDSSYYALSFNDFLSTTSSEGDEFSLNITSYLKDGQRACKIMRYNQNCENDNQISYILPLVRVGSKFWIFILLNIFTLGIINIFLYYYPKLYLYIYYDVTALKSSTNFGIFSKDGKEFEIVEKVTIDLPQIDYNSEERIIKNFNLNIEPGINTLIAFQYRYFKYIYSNMKDNFEALYSYIKTTNKNILEDFSKGLNSNEVLYMQKIFGKCDIEIEMVSCLNILFEELADPSYLFLLYSFVLWICLGSYIYTLILLIVEIVCCFLSVKETYGNQKKIQKLSRYSCPINVYRKIENNKNLEKIEINSCELVPGDLFEIPSDGFEMPCDAILIEGIVILEESKLTGDIHSIIKTSIKSNEKIFNTNHEDCSKHMIYAGTKIIHINKIGNSEAKGIVFRTGFNTTKGEIIINILNSEEDNETFLSDSVKYILIMGILTIVFFGIALKFLIVESEDSAHDIIIFFFGFNN